MGGAPLLLRATHDRGTQGERGGFLLLGGRRYPIVLVIVFKAVSMHRFLEKAAQVLVVRFLIKAQVATIDKVVREGRLLGETTGQLLNCCRYLLVLDPVVFLFLCATVKPLPRQLPFQKVNQYVSNRLNVISSRLFNAQVSIHRCIPGRASELFLIFIRNVFARLRVAVPLREAEVDHVDDVLCLLGGDAHEEVVRLDVPVDEVVVVEELDPLKQLVRKHKHRFQRKLPLTLGEEVLEALAQEVHNHRVVVTLNSKPVHLGNAH